MSFALHVSCARFAAAGIPATKHFGRQRPSRASEPPNVALQVSYTPSAPASASAESVGSHFRSIAASVEAAHVSCPYAALRSGSVMLLVFTHLPAGEPAEVMQQV